MLPEQKAYIYAWVDGVTAAGFRAGIYCSGIPAADDGNVVTAEDIRQSAGGRQIVYWAINDACPPAPGCSFPKRTRQAPPKAALASPKSGSSRSRRSAKTLPRHCANYNRDGELLSAGNFRRATVACRRELSH